jgi:hypothetical protein
MRWVVAGVALYALVVVVGQEPTAAARPEFARRESLACGYCHIQPRGGGPRNSNGLRYARNEFSFPAEKGDLNSFEDEKDRAAMVRARKLLRVDNVQAAHKELTRLARRVKEPAARKLVEAELHAIAVKGDEMLGQARLLLRKSSEKKQATGVEMLCVVASAYRGVNAEREASDQLKELGKDKEFKDLIKQEEREEKARQVLLGGLALRIDGKEKSARKVFEKVRKSYAGTRADREAELLLDPEKAKAEAEAEKEAESAE